MTPKNAVLLYVIHFKKINEKFIVKLEHFDEEYKIDSVESNEIRRFFDFLVKLAMDNYRKGFKDFIQQKNTNKPIGFISLTPES